MQIGFTNIRYDYRWGNYALFFNQGLTPTMILTRNNGELLIESGRYDGISAFYDKYALVSKEGKIGLVDTSGREVITPKDLRTYEGQFIDSLDIINKLIRELEKKNINHSNLESIDLPIELTFNSQEWHPDSLKITKEIRRALWNLMLDKIRFNVIKTASDFKILRATQKASAAFIDTNGGNEREFYTEPLRITFGDATIAFALRMNNKFKNRDIYFYNFYYKNNRWEELNINDLLQIQGENRWIINDLITKKVKALKDKEIDCSNASAFITTVENRWLLTKEGIEFCFEDKSDSNDFVVISFTWAELKPYLKLKIGH